MSGLDGGSLNRFDGHPLPDAVLVDMDGTLVDTERLWYLAEVDTMRALGGEWTLEDQAYSLGGPLERVTRYMLERAGSTAMEPEAVGELLLDTVEQHMRGGDLAFTPGTSDLLDGLVDAGIPLALVSASPRRLIDVVLGTLGATHFAATVAGDEVRRGKPDPEPYLTAAAQLRVDPRRCVVLEDSPTGVRAGLACGAVVVAIPHLVPIEAGERLVVVDSLAEVTPAHLAEWLASAGS